MQEAAELKQEVETLWRYNKRLVVALERSDRKVIKCCDDFLANVRV